MLTLYFDYVSLGSCVVVRRLHRLATTGSVVHIVGVDVLGVATSLPVTLDQRVEIDAWRERALAEGLEIALPSVRPPTVDAHLVGGVADEQGCGTAFRERAIRAYWSQGLDIAAYDVLLELATAAGVDVAVVRERLHDPVARTRLRQRMAADRGRGIGGVPVLELDGAMVPADLDERELAELARL